MNTRGLRKSLFAAVAILALLPAGHCPAQEAKTPAAGSATAAGDIADFFSKVGNQIYEHCIFELSQEQLEVQQALIAAYVKQGASNLLARRLAVKQIHPPSCLMNASKSKISRKLPPRFRSARLGS